MPQGHAFLIGLGGTGRQSLTRLAAYLCDQALVDIDTSKNYHEEQWREQLKSVIMKAGQDGKSCVLLLPDSKIKGSFMLDDINNLLNSGDVPNLFLADEKMKIEESLRATAKRAGKVSLYSSDNH
jgi:dynein heavy chain